MLNTVLSISMKLSKGLRYCSRAAKDCGKVAIKDAKNCKNIPVNIVNGVRQANRLARIQNQSIFEQIGTQGIAIARQTNKHIPGIFAAATVPTPVPSALAYILGKFIQKGLIKIL